MAKKKIGLSEFADKVRKLLNEDTEETPETTNLEMSPQQLLDAIADEANGPALRQFFLDGEWRICVRMGLISGVEAGKLKIPGWKNLMAHLRVTYSVLRGNK
jgi:hypothetical protein